MGSVGDSYDNVLAEAINGLYKAETILQATRGKSVGQIAAQVSGGGGSNFPNTNIR